MIESDTKGSEKLLLRSRLREILVPFPQIIEGDPRRWWRETAKMVVGIRRNLDNEPPELANYLKEYLPFVYDSLHRESKCCCDPSDTNSTDGCAVIAEKNISAVSMLMAERFDKKGEVVRENIISLQDMAKNHPESFEVLAEKEIQGIRFIQFGVTPYPGSGQTILLIPKDLPVGFKGGVVRGVIDCLHHSPLSMLKKEFPPSDHDAIALEGNYNPRVVAEVMGVDPDGLEMFRGEKINFTDYALGRDTTQNQTYLDSSGLHFSDEAMESAKTGKIRIVGGYKPNKAIYGIDLVIADGISLSKPRGQMRLVKPVAEGKALEFDYLPLNSIMDFGIYSLFLARKWAKKENFGEYLQNMYYLHKQMGQIRENEKDVMKLLNRVHRENPYYDMRKEVMNIIELVGYKAVKLIKQVDREAGWVLNIPSGLVVTRFANDIVPGRISLDGFTPSDELTERISRWWPGFLKECDRRTLAFTRKYIDPVTKYFIRQDIEDMGDARTDWDFTD